MAQIAVILFLALLTLVVVQASLVFGYCLALYRFRRQKLDDKACPHAAVILCVRGCDPTLAACLDGLFRQDYPSYDVWVVVDSVDDAAWPLAHEIVRQTGAKHVQIMLLTERLTTCSRKIAGLLQAISELDESHEIIAMLDADVPPQRDWLRSLVEPLLHPDVGVASGNRWYLPDKPTLGAVVRYHWNAAAVVQMYWYGIAWGGSLALKTRLLRETNLRERLEHAFGEDSTICRCARDHGLRIVLVPSLLMVDRGSCNVRGFFSFLQRQLLTVKLHNPWWWAVVAHGVTTSVAMALAGVLLAVAAMIGCLDAAAWCVAALVGYWASMVFLLLPIDWCVAKIVRSRGERCPPSRAAQWLGIVMAIPITQIVYALGLASMFFLRTHLWRGVRYRIDGSKRICVIEDRAIAIDNPHQAESMPS